MGKQFRLGIILFGYYSTKVSTYPLCFYYFLSLLLFFFFFASIFDYLSGVVPASVAKLIHVSSVDALSGEKKKGKITLQLVEASQHRDIPADFLPMKDHLLCFAPAKPLSTSEVYHIHIGMLFPLFLGTTYLMEFTGHHLQSCEGPLVSDEDLQFFFITAPSFGVLSVTDPTPGAPILAVEFNQHLQSDLEWTPTITPPINGRWSLTSGSTVLEFTPEAEWKNSTM